MRPTHFAVLTILLAAAAAPGQTAPAEGLPKPPLPIFLPPPPSSVPQARITPSVTVPQPAPLAPPEPAAEAVQATPETLMSFDPGRAEVRREGNNWQLVVDGVVLKDFSWHENDARMALHLVHELRLNQHGAVGAPVPVMEYWLHDGKAPHGQTAGLQVYSINPATLRVEQVEGDNWCLRDAQRLLFNFGPSQVDAQQALGVIQKYGFAQIGALGQSGPAMLVFFGRTVTIPVSAPAVLPAEHHPAATPAAPAAEHQAPAYLPAYEWQVKPAATGHGDRGGMSHAIAPLVQPGAVITTNASETTRLTERTPMDWRQVQVQKDGNVWKLMAGTRQIAVFNSERESNLALSVVQYYRFTEHEQVGSPKVHFSYFLVDGQVPRGAMIGIHCEVFQPDRLRIVQAGNRWTISTGERALLSFDDKLDEARHVLDLIQKNKCDRLCRVGLSDDYSMTFLARTR